MANATTGGSDLFSSRCTFLTWRTPTFGMFWPILAILLRIYALFGVQFKGLNSAVAYHNWQISGVVEFITKTSVNGIFNGTLSGGLWSWLVSPQFSDQIVLLYV